MKLKLTARIILIFLSGLCSLAYGDVHRQHGAHKHGSAKMGIAFESFKGQLTLQLASEAIFGFEYVPKKEADKIKQREGLEKLERNMASMVAFASDLKCVFSKEKLEVDYHEGGKHSDIDATFNIVCEKDPLGSTLTFNIQKFFPKLADVDVQLLFADLQKSVEANATGFKVELKK